MTLYCHILFLPSAKASTGTMACQSADSMMLTMYSVPL